MEDREEGEDCVGRPKAEGSAACVETTAYALLALRAAGDTRSTVCLARWLVRIRSGNGGYWSSQVRGVAVGGAWEWGRGCTIVKLRAVYYCVSS